MADRDITGDRLDALALLDAAGFSAMVERYYGRIFFTALGVCGDEEMAQDIAQETFLRVWLKRGEVEGMVLQLQPWLCRIAWNLSVDWMRRGQQRSRVLPLISLEDISVEPADVHNLDPRDAATRKEEAAQLLEAVSGLPEEMRQVVMLHYGEGMSASDIARLNGEAPSTVTRRLKSAQAQLRGQLESGLARGLAGLRPGVGVARKTAAVVAGVRRGAVVRVRDRNAAAGCFDGCGGEVFG